MRRDRQRTRRARVNAETSAMRRIRVVAPRERERPHRGTLARAAAASAARDAYQRRASSIASPRHSRPAGRPLASHCFAAARELREERGVLLVLVEPAPQRRPALDQRLVDDLDRAAAAHRRASARRAGARATSRSITRASSAARGAELLQLGELDDRARALGRDQLRKIFCVSSLRVAFMLRDDLVGVRGERAGDAADRLVARAVSSGARDRARPTAWPRRTAGAAARPACRASASSMSSTIAGALEA